MPTRIEFQQMAFKKIEEAKALLASNLPDGAFYIAGYALEFSLKAAVCKTLRMDDFFLEKKAAPSPVIKETLRGFKIHDYSQLLILAGLYYELESAKSNDRNLFRNWSIIEGMKWSEQCRYDYLIKSSNDVSNFIDAIDAKTKGGFLQWIQEHW